MSVEDRCQTEQLAASGHDVTVSGWRLTWTGPINNGMDGMGEDIYKDPNQPLQIRVFLIIIHVVILFPYIY